MSRIGKWLMVLVVGLIVPALLIWSWPRPQEVLYSLYREHGKEQVLAGLDGYQSKTSDHFVIYYTDADANNAGLILKTAESVYGPVVKAIGYHPDRVPLIVYPNRTVLRQAFGWGNGESALGVYWAGTIRLLSPNVWIDESSEKAKRKAFTKLNPIAHELTHYLLDYLTSGNYPRWFTEGLAQRVEHHVTGYLWIESKSTLRQPLYSLTDLQDRFDSLPNQPLAYRESYLLVDYLARTYGENQLQALIARLAGGTRFAEAVQQTTGKSLPAFYNDWTAWVQAHLDELDPTGRG